MLNGFFMNTVILWGDCMVVTIYNYSGDNRQIDRTPNLTQLETHSGTIRDYVEIVNPKILVNGNVKIGNYCYIDEFQSYYFITEKTIVRNNLTELTLKRDGAFTFLNQIKNCPCICARTGKEQKYNSDFADNRYNTYQNKYIETYVLAALSNDDAIIFAFVE